ncbi:hypothetical protein BZA05DRAFT_136244 [Tricharina praecox]|uniref:uncharacterized protein n=1 Tax=Tricharina praecox TaxID=43433 RepID=UPI00221E9AC6|nr:uncharacterized protein BZA05DRAFT_136244 [Tricharina praecox]KAI5846797.1 hypothetical protein BZA05DRAFT_136244 [Tricharina praecox]
MKVTHTNDLTNLCLTCRSLHSLAVPQIYARFDIVWPDAATTGERVGVDALTHGLATLTNVTRRGNDHARWVKKFSLGNGPGEWVMEYNINKEGGKMLGTLVNLGITRMESLETFSWDMPTGILRDVFMSLHDLNGTLKNVHVRFHDNRETTTPTSHDPSRKVETPTFKGFKGLRSLSVLDIDERQYLEEMAYAIEESADKLRELRVGLAEHMHLTNRWIKDWDELELTNAEDGNNTSVGGGVLGLLFGRIVNWGEGRRKRRSNRPEDAGTGAPAPPPSSPPVNVTVAAISAAINATTGNTAVATPAAVVAAAATVSSGAAPAVVTPTSVPNAAVSGVTDDQANVNMIGVPAPSSGAPPAAAHSAAAPLAPVQLPSPTAPPAPWTPLGEGLQEIKSTARPYNAQFESKPSKQLRLETLALERVPISIPMLVTAKAIDWTCLSNLTIVNCYNHDRFFKALRRKFSPCLPPTVLHTTGINPKHGHPSVAAHRVRGMHQAVPSPSDYKLRLKKLHTDCVTPVLIAFIRDTLPPNSLEILFLQETANDSTVTMDIIYKGAIRRHKGSLKKLLVNSKHNDDADGMFKWTFKKEHLAFISSGKMPNLRELGMALEYSDWHYFLTRLPHMPQLRSLYLTYIRDTPHLTGFAPRELANQIVNTVILRPEVELCYVGILNKCFEILEGRSDDPDLPDLPEPQAPDGITGGPPAPPGQDSDDEEESELDDEDEEDDDLVDDDDADDSESDGGYSEDEKQKTGIRLREILFYDDKVEIFRARNASL